MIATEPDVIDLLVGVKKGSSLDAIRAQRPEARENAQKSYLALFAPKFANDVSGEERYAVATFVTGLHRDAETLAFYKEGLARQSLRKGVAEAIDAEIADGAAEGPFGRYPKGPLSVEDTTGPLFRVAESHRKILGARLSAALEHAHLLVFHPRDASPAALQALLDAGLSTTDIVTLSQLVSFLSFQIRVIVGLRALAAASKDNG